MDMEALEDQLCEVKNDMEAKFEALKELTISELGNERRHRIQIEQRLATLEKKVDKLNVKDIEGQDESFQSLKDELSGWNMKNATEADLVETPGRSDDGKVETVNRKRVCVAEEEEVIPYSIEDLESEDVREKIRSYYVARSFTGETLPPAQLASLYYWLIDVRGGAVPVRSEVIRELHKLGVKTGMWPRNWEPEGIRVPFLSYLKEKTRNIAKRRKTEENAKLYKSAQDLVVGGVPNK